MKATIESFDAIEELYQSECNLIVRGNEITVSYKDDDGRPVIYRGPLTQFGYRLVCEERKGWATLHPLNAQNPSFEGSWIENGYRGMWIIDVDEE